MQCPNCQFSPIPEGAQICPRCGAALNSPGGAPRVQVNVQAQQNQGSIIGVQAGQVNGDVYGGNIIYLLSGAGRTAGAGSFFKKSSPPYKGLAAYTPLDSPVFKGREREIGQVIGRIGEQPVLTVSGASGVGKTSLLAAGVIPRLADAGALAVYLRDYTRSPFETLRDALTASAAQIPLQMPANGGLPGLVRALRDGLGGTLVLIFDHAESLDSPAAAGWVGELAQALDTVGAEYLRLIFSVEEAAALRLQTVCARLPDVLSNSLSLLPLAPDQAREAIIEPLGRLDSPFHYDIGIDPDLVDTLLLSDLDELSQDSPGFIYPPHLQIVCDRLYRAARENNQRQIDKTLYLKNLQGADGILAGYLVEKLALLPAVDQPAGRSLLIWMAGQPPSGWFDTAALPEGSAPDVLVTCGLLMDRPVNSHREYALTSAALAHEIKVSLGGLQDSAYDPQADLSRLWAAWQLAPHPLPDEAQLRRLESAAGRCPHFTAQALLLARAAAHNNLPSAPWLAWLRSSIDAKALVQRLEGIQDVENERKNYASHLDKAQRILGLSNLPEPPGGWQSQTFGPLAWGAVTHPDPAVREASALALALLDDSAGINRLDQALWARPGSASRAAELRGVLADASPLVEKENSHKPVIERARIHLWRAGRRIARDWQRVTAYTLGGGLGAGLGLGLLRGLTAAFTHQTVGLHAFMNFGFGFLLGAALLFGMLLVDYLRLQHATSGWPRRRAIVFACLLGGAAFGVAGVVVALSTGSLAFSGKELVMLSGLAAGVLLALSLYPFPYQADKAGFLHMGSLRVLAAGGLFTGVQGAFLAAGIEDSGLVIVWPSVIYRGWLDRDPLLLLKSIPAWPAALGLLDAFLTGAVLCAGILISIRVAAHILAHWYSLAHSWTEE
jgi:hypothetical protein